MSSGPAVNMSCAGAVGRNEVGNSKVGALRKVQGKAPRADNSAHMTTVPANRASTTSTASWATS